MNLEWNFNSMTDFYVATETLLPTGNPSEWKKQCDSSDYNSSWVGLPRKDIEPCKWRYNKPVLSLSNRYDKAIIGGTSKVKIWSEYDGYDLSYDRLIDGFPSLRDYRRKSGNAKGKFVTIHVNIGENCGVSAEQMMSKAMTTMQLIDILEESNCRIAVEISEVCYRPGTVNGKDVEWLQWNATVKKFEDVMNKPLIFTAISPWILRYHGFKLQAARTYPFSGYGQARRFSNRICDLDHIYIDNQECLNQNIGLRTIDQIVKEHSE